MINNQRKMVVGAVLLGLCALQTQAVAAQMNVAATAFHRQFMGPTDAIWYFGTTASNVSAAPLLMFAELPRVPGGTAVTVSVDGYGVSGTYSCSVMASSATAGSFTRSFTRSSPSSWTSSVNFSAAELTSSSYLSISCTVPADGAIRGVTISN